LFLNYQDVGEEPIKNIRKQSDVCLIEEKETGDHLVQISLPFDYTVGTSPINNATWSLQVWKSGSSGETLLQKDVQYFVAGDPISSTLYFTYYTSGDFYFTLSEAIPSTNIVIS
jgi:hypothetical protein